MHHRDGANRAINVLSRHAPHTNKYQQTKTGRHLAACRVAHNQDVIGGHQRDLMPIGGMHQYTLRHRHHCLVTHLMYLDRTHQRSLPSRRVMRRPLPSPPPQTSYRQLCDNVCESF